MVDFENLEIIIDLFSGDAIFEIERLIGVLEQLEVVARAVDDIRIDVDVTGESEIAALTAELAALRAFSGDLNVGVDVDRDGGGVAVGQMAVPDELLSKMDDLIGSLDGGGGDGLSGAARSAKNFSNTVDDASGIFRLRMSDMHNALATAIPVILTFVGALPALLTGLVAVGAAALSAAAALAAIAGFGALGAAIAAGGVDNIGEGFKEIMSDIRDSFIDSFRPLAESLTPLFEDALDGLERLFQAIANRGDVLQSLTDDARAFGGFLLDFVPAALASMGRMVDAFSGVFGIIADFLRENSLLEFLTQFMADVLPAFSDFMALLGSLIPPLLQVSIGFLRVANAILLVFNVLGKLISLTGLTGEQLGFLIGTVLTIASAMSLWSFITTSSLIPSLIALGTRILAAISTYTSYSASALVATAATHGLSTALLGLIGVATLGLGLIALTGVIGAIGSSFSTMGEDIRGATDALRDFDSTASDVSGRNPFINPEANVQRGSVTADRFSGGGGTTINVDARGSDREEVEAVTQSTLWRNRKESSSR